MAKRHGAEFWREHLEEWHRSNLTQIEYCAGHGLNAKSLRRWLQREKEEAAVAKAALTLVPVSVGAPVTWGVVRLHSPGGWRIELPDGNVSWLADILRQLP